MIIEYDWIDNLDYKYGDISNISDQLTLRVQIWRVKSHRFRGNSRTHRRRGEGVQVLEEISKSQGVIRSKIR